VPGPSVPGRCSLPCAAARAAHRVSLFFFSSLLLAGGTAGTRHFFFSCGQVSRAVCFSCSRRHCRFALFFVPGFPNLIGKGFLLSCWTGTPPFLRASRATSNRHRFPLFRITGSGKTSCARVRPCLRNVERAALPFPFCCFRSCFAETGFFSPFPFFPPPPGGSVVRCIGQLTGARRPVFFFSPFPR